MSDSKPAKGAEQIFGHIDPDAMKVVRRLLQAGHEAYLVGGCVRDLYLGHSPKDFDVATSATPEAIRKLFRNSRVIGRRFKLAHVFFGPKIIETSTFRAPPKQDDDDPLITHDNEWGSVEDDARRRDFTVNGLFYDVETRRIVDFVDGMDDLDREVIRTIGEPALRFREDPVRMIRAIKFAARLDFRIDDETWKALLEVAPDIVRSSRARLLEEIYKLLRSGASRRCFELLLETGMLHRIMPSYTQQFGAAADGTAALHIGLHGPHDAAPEPSEDAPAAAAASQDEPAPDAPSEAAAAPADSDAAAPAESDAADPASDDADTPAEDSTAAAPAQAEADPSDEKTLPVDSSGEPARLLWRYLDSLDDYIRTTHDDVVNGVLQAVLFAPLVKQEMVEGSRQTLDRAIERAMTPVGTSFGVARRDRELARQILMSHRRMTDQRRRRRRGSVAQRQYFHDALVFLGVSVRALSDGGSELSRWQTMAKEQQEAPNNERSGSGRKRSRRRRGGRRNKKSDGGQQAASSRDG